MKIFPTEWLIAMNPGYSQDSGLSVFAAFRVRIRAVDEGAGMYLIVRGENDEPDTVGGENGHEFHLGTHEEIDSFAAVLHMALRAAEGQEAVS
jgi:hypothetical protein